MKYLAADLGKENIRVNAISERSSNTFGERRSLI